MSKSFSSSSSSTIHHQKEKKGHDLLVVVIGFMATKLVQPPVPASHVAPPIPRLTKMMRAHRPVTATHSGSRRGSIFGEFPSGFRPFYAIRVAEQSPGLVGDDQDIVVKEEEEEEEDEQEGASSDDRTIANVKADLYQAVQGINRGVFGVPSAKKSEIEALVKLLESQNPTPEPILNLDKVNGWWKLVYSTITILGSKRTKLGLRNFITLGDFLQIIDVEEAKAVNVIKFNARGFNFLNGELKIEASFKIASKSRVDIKYDSSTITPDKLMNVFKQNYDLLLGIFNPEGWLEITYLDESMRIGRDDKGNLFILERSEAT